MKKFLFRLLAFIGAMTILMFISGIVGGILLSNKKKVVSDNTILELNLSGEFIEYVPDDPSARIIHADRLTMADIIEALEMASADNRVKALIARIGQPHMGLAQIQEIRDAILAFRDKGKTAVAYSDTFGEFGPGNKVYYLATAFDKIYLQPSGDIGLTGLMFESGFFKGTLKKLGLKPRMSHRYEYKNAVNIFTEDAYTEPHKKALETVMSSHFGQIAKDIAASRNLSEAEIRALADHGLFFGKEAVEAKLVDEVAYRDEVYEKIRQEAGRNCDLLYLSHYLKRTERLYKKGETLALIYGVGAVHRGKSDYSPMSGETSMGSRTVATAFRQAIKDDSVKAILFRIDSPGGSYVASDTIWREVVRAKEAGKPVIVSMGNVAASGGYFVAMAADKIVAQPGTITGSIGVFAGKMLTSDFWEKLGVSWDEIHTSEKATMWTGTHDYTAEQWERIQDALDRIYEDFTSKAAQGRNLPIERVLEIAKGRIWTGEDAKDLGLVDELGGIPRAIELAKNAAGISRDAAVRLKQFPKKRPLVEVLLETLPENSEETAMDVGVVRSLEKIQPLVRTISQLGLGSDPGVLLMPFPAEWVKEME